MSEASFRYSLDFSVRDYECDLQGIVNNANYLHYLEHARHQFLLGLGVDFSALHDQGIDLVVSRVEVDYKQSLRSRDEFTVSLNLVKHGNLRMVFEQEIRNKVTGAVAIEAKVIGVCLRNGRPVKPESVPEIAAVLGS